MSIEKNLKSLKDQLEEINDVRSVTKILAEKIQFLAQQGYQQSQATESIDEKIRMLVGTIQTLANEVVEFHNNKEKEVEILEIKIELLEKIIEESPSQDTSVPSIIEEKSEEDTTDELDEDEKKDS